MFFSHDYLDGKAIVHPENEPQKLIQILIHIILIETTTGCCDTVDVFITRFNQLSEAINNYSLHCSVEQHITLIMTLARLNFYKVQNINCF